MKLRIAQVAPLYESVPPKLYGGTERVVSFLTEELVSRGHEVTLFASGDSETTANLIPVCERAIRLDTNCVDPLASHVIQLQMVQNFSRHFDIIHYHTDYLHFPVSRLVRTQHLTTLHGRLNIPELKRLYQFFPDMPVVSISLNQRKALPDAHWVGNVYHGLPENLLRPNYSKGRYLAFLGRISREKGVENAIEIAKRTGIPLKIAAKVDNADREYFEYIRIQFDHPLIEYLGEICEHEKTDFLGNAIALLFPIVWPEPFGLVMVEALACGTPIIAYPNGSVPEIVEHGVNGFIATNVGEAVASIENILAISRNTCRQTFEHRFTSRSMALAYESLYHKQLRNRENRHDSKLLYV
jgi:glycosyltransferase involved in cell wall biosynthesis